MWKSYLLYSICVFTLLTSCNKEDIKLDASTVIDWFAYRTNRRTGAFTS